VSTVTESTDTASTLRRLHEQRDRAVIWRRAAAQRSSGETVQRVALPLTRLSVGEMSVGNLTRDMLAQFHNMLLLLHFFVKFLA